MAVISGQDNGEAPLGSQSYSTAAPDARLNVLRRRLDSPPIGQMRVLTLEQEDTAGKPGSRNAEMACAAKASRAGGIDLPRGGLEISG